VLVADPAAQFLYYNESVFQIDAMGTLGSPLTVPGITNVTGIAAANPDDSDPVQPISAPVAALAPPSLQFPSQTVGTASQPQEISLSNTGTAPLIVSNIVSEGMHRGDFSAARNCIGALAAGAECLIAVTFQPSLTGIREAILEISDDAIGSPHTVELTGTGQLPFTIQLDGSTDSVVAGQIAQYDLRLVPALGFTGQVLLACTGAPAGAFCDVPPSVQLNGATPTPFSASVRTTARSAALRHSRRPDPSVGNEPSRRFLAWASLVVLVALLLVRPKPAPAAVAWPQQWIRCVVALLLVCISLGLASCAGVTDSGTSSPPDSALSGTPAGTYTLMLTASSGSATQTVPLTLAVQ
jgi:hypothetical protein